MIVLDETYFLLEWTCPVDIMSLVNEEGRRKIDDAAYRFYRGGVGMRPTAATAREPQNTIIFLLCVHMECQKNILELLETLPRRNKKKTQ
jgi:hypothetical protein